MDDRLQELADRQEITNLLYEYCRNLDLMDLPALVRVFTEDCIVDYGPEERKKHQGRANLAHALRGNWWRWVHTSHHLSNVQIEFDDRDNARSFSCLIAWHQRSDGASGTLYGEYQDRLVRTEEGWRIAHRRLMMKGREGLYDSINHPFPRVPPPEEG